MAEFVLTMDFLIPFIFVLAIVFGSLEIVKVFKNRAVHFIISLAIAFFASTYDPFVAVLWANLPLVTWFFIIIFFIGFIMKILGLGKEKKLVSETLLIYGVLLFVLLAVGWYAIDQLDIELPYIGSGENLIIIISLIVIGAIFFIAFRLGSTVHAEEQYKAAKEQAKGK